MKFHQSLILRASHAREQPNVISGGGLRMRMRVGWAALQPLLALAPIYARDHSSTKTWGCFSAISSNRSAEPEGFRNPCSHFAAVPLVT